MTNIRELSISSIGIMPHEDGSLTSAEIRKKARKEDPLFLLDGRALDEKMRKPAKHISYGECPYCRKKMCIDMIRKHVMMEHPLRDMDGNEIDPTYRTQATPDDAMRNQETKREIQKEQREKEAKKK